MDLLCTCPQNGTAGHFICRSNGLFLDPTLCSKSRLPVTALNMTSSVSQHSDAC